MARTRRSPFEVKLSPVQQDEIVDFLQREITYAIQAREAIVGDNQRIDQAHLMYEGGDGTLTKNTPWPNAANLGSFIVTEKVDAMRARIVATLFADPVWIVEGYGPAAQRAPLVEAFHQWKSEMERLQQFVSRATHNSLIEGLGVLEISDQPVLRSGVRKMHVLLQRDEQSGEIVMGPDGGPVPVRSKDGRFVEAQDGEPYAITVVKEPMRVSAGPAFRVLSLKDFFILPGHATERADIWGYAKRVYRRLPDLRAAESQGFYRNVDQLGEAGERQQTPSELRAGQDVAPQIDDTAEMEIWEVTYLADHDGDGFEEWYVCTLSITKRVLLRMQYQDYGTPHYALFAPFPRPHSIYGYSYAIDKLGSLYDEHAAVRNMFADRSTLATAAPWLQLVGSAWNPDKRPFGPRQVIPVRDMNELKQLDVRDVPNSVMAWLGQILSAAERISGQNDVTTGHMAQQDRTLGEVKIVTEQSFVRIDEVVKNFQEGMEDLFDLHHLIWKHKLADEPEPLPGDLLQTMTERGIDIPQGMVTADLLEGAFRGKPHGSVESADFSKMRVDFAGLMTALTQLAQAVPAVRAHLNDPTVVRSIVSQLARIYQWPDRANLVSNFTGIAPPAPAPVTPGSPFPGTPANAIPPPHA